MIRHTLKLSWWLLILSLLLAAMLTAFRFAFPILGQYKSTLEVQLTEQLGFPVSIGELETSWRGPFPSLAAKDLRAQLGGETSAQAEVALAQVSFEVNIWQSLLDFAPIFQQVDASGFKANLIQRNGRWLPDIKQDQRQPAGQLLAGWFLNTLMAQPHFLIKESEVNFQSESGVSHTLKLNTLLLENARDQHQLSGNFWMTDLGQNTRLDFAIQLFDSTTSAERQIFPFYLKLDHLGTQVFDLFQLPLKIDQLDASMELWGDLQEGRLTLLSGQAQIDQASIPLTDSHIELVESRTSFQLTPVGQGYQLQLHDTKLSDGQGEVELPAIALDLLYHNQEASISRLMGVDTPLSQLSAWLIRQPIQSQVAEILRALDVQGVLDNWVVDLSDKQSGPSLRADLSDGRVNSWHGVPEMRSVTGLLQLDKQGGQFDLDARDFFLHPVGVYSNPLVFDSARGRISWNLNSSSVWLRSGDLDVDYAGIPAKGRFSIELPYDPQQQAMLNLQVGLHNAQLDRGLQLVPRAQVGEPLDDWLQRSFSSGQVSAAGLVVYAPTRYLEDRPSPSVELFVDATQVGLDYQPPWPALTQANSFVHLRDGELLVQLENAFVKNQQVGSALAWKPVGKTELMVSVDLAGELQSIDQLFHEKPLDTLVGVRLGDWHLSGPHQSNLSLNIDLENSAKTRVTTLSQVKKGRFSSESQRIDLSDISGDIHFDSNSGLSFNAASAKLFDREVSVNATSEPGSTSLSFNGKFDPRTLLEWAGVPITELVKGEIGLQGKLRLCSRVDCLSQLQLESDLNGVSVMAPDYLAKTEKSVSRLSLMVNLASPAQLQLNYADRLKGNFRLGGSLSGVLTLGGGVAKAATGAGLLLNGRVPGLDLNQLYTLIDRLNLGGDADSNSPVFRSDIRVDTITLGSLHVDNVQAGLRKLDSEWHLALQGGADGLIAWGPDGAPIRVALNQLAIQQNAPQSPAKDDLFELTDQGILKSIPDIDLEVADLRWKEAALGRWKGAMRTRDDGVTIKQIQGSLPGISFTGTADWNLGASETSKLILNYTGDDFGDSLESLGETRIIETEKLNGTLGLIWAGAPWSYDSKRLNGYVRFGAENGRLIEAGAGTGLLRLFGILNFNSLARRLRLDFTDLYAKGIVFDRLIGEYLIQQGVVKSTRPLEMVGPSATLNAEGSISLIDKTLDQRVQVTLPLLSTTPLAAVLLGAPQIAGALFLIDKLIGDKLNKVSAISYSLKGPWDEPALELDSASKN